MEQGAGVTCVRLFSNNNDNYFAVAIGSNATLK